MEPEIPILYQDPWMIVAEKPGGLLVHRTSESTDDRFLLQILRAQTGQFLYPVHRLDRATSGVIAFALSSESAQALQESLQSDQTLKEYITFVRGKAPESGEIKKTLTNDQGVVQEAHTEFERIAFIWEGTLLKARIYTGRRHQIRRHLSHLTHQVIGDSQYGKGRINRRAREEFGLPRLFLHATRLEFVHPFTKQKASFWSRLPQELADFLRRLPDPPHAIIDQL